MIPQAVMVAPDIYKIFTLVSGVYLIRSEHGNTLIDCGYFLERELIVAGLKKILGPNFSIKNLLLTHCHPDHDGNAHFFKQRFGAEVITTTAEFDYARQAMRVDMKKFSQLGWFARPFFTFFTKITPQIPLPVTQTLADQQEFNHIRVILAPGHTPGSAFFLHQPTQTLFSGDTLLSAIPPWAIRQGLSLPEPAYATNYAQALQSVQKLMQLNFENLCPGHGKPLIGGASQTVRGFLETV